MSDLFQSAVVTDGANLVPHSREAEEDVLGALLIAPEQLREIAGIVRVNDFHIHRHQWVYQAMLDIAERGVLLDYRLLCDELENQDHLEGIGGAAYLTHLMSGVLGPYNAVAYAGIIAEKAARRSMLEAAQKIAKLAYDEATPLDQCLSAMSQSEQAVFENVNVGDDWVDMGAALSKQYDQMEAVSKGEIVRVDTPWQKLNELLNGGFANWQFVTVAGRPGSGKSSFFRNLAEHIGTHKKIKGEVAVLSLEMDDIEIVAGILAQNGINTQRLATGRLTDDEYKIYASQINLLPQARIKINYAATIPLMRSKLAKLASRSKLACIMVDYTQLMEGEGHNRNLEIGYITRNLKLFATQEFKCPVIAGSQLSRDIERRSDTRPRLSDLRDSGSLEQDSDIVIFIDRAELRGEADRMGEAEFIVAKHRGGPIGLVPMIYRKQYTRFESARVNTVDLKNVV